MQCLGSMPRGCGGLWRVFEGVDCKWLIEEYQHPRKRIVNVAQGVYLTFMRCRLGCDETS